MKVPARAAVRSDLALLALRAVLGIAFILHGFPKILHPTTWISGILPRAPAWLGAVDAFVEFGGGIAILTGFATAAFAFLIACDMAVAILFVHVPHGAVFVNLPPMHKETFELPVAYLVMALAIILLGPGAYALDAARNRSRSGPRRWR
jgi:putative oxidoreductase